MSGISKPSDAKRELMECVSNAILAMQQDLELRIARKCRFEWGMPAAVGINMSTQIGKAVADIILGGVILEVDKKVEAML